MWGVEVQGRELGVGDPVEDVDAALKTIRWMTERNHKERFSAEMKHHVGAARS